MNEDRPTEFEVALDQTPAPMPEASLAERIAATVEDFGLLVPPGFVLTMERELHREAFKLAGEALHRLSLRLPRHSTAGIALARIIRGPEGKSLREAGRDCGVSGVAILKAERRIQARLRLAVPSLVEHERESIRESGERS
jgi:hypothetical protein